MQILLNEFKMFKSKFAWIVIGLVSVAPFQAFQIQLELIRLTLLVVAGGDDGSLERRVKRCRR